MQDKEGQYLMIHGSILQKDTKTIWRTYMHLITSSKIHEVKTNKKGRKDSSTIMMKDFNTSHLVINKTSKQTIG